MHSFDHSKRPREDGIEPFTMILAVIGMSLVAMVTFSILTLYDIAIATLTPVPTSNQTNQTNQTNPTNPTNPTNQTNQTNQTTHSTSITPTNTVKATETANITKTEPQMIAASSEKGTTTTTITTTTTTRITRPTGTETNETGPTGQVADLGARNNMIETVNSSSGVEAPSNAVLHIVSSLNNNCHPNDECSGVRADELFRTQIFTNQSKTNESLSIIKASEVSRPISIPIIRNQTIEYAIKQLDVQENSVFKPRYNISSTYLTECQGTIKADEGKECIILSSLEDKDSPKGSLQVITTVRNDCALTQFNYCGVCQSKNICTNVRADDLFSNHISTFSQNIHKEAFSIPASEAGWIVEVFPDHSSGLVQYDIKQTIDNTQHILSARSINVTYSPECHGTLRDGEAKKCEIVNHTLLP
jgi:hypothetical protein